MVIRGMVEDSLEDSVGTTLSLRRQASGISIEEVSQALNIKKDYIAAIENNQLETLPGKIYSSGFIRSYAKFLKLDPDQIIKRLMAEQNVLETEQDLQFPLSVPNSGMPRKSIVILGIIILLIGYSLWTNTSPTKVPTITSLDNDIRNNVVVEKVYSAPNIQNNNPTDSRAAIAAQPKNIDVKESSSKISVKEGNPTNNNLVNNSVKLDVDENIGTSVLQPQINGNSENRPTLNSIDSRILITAKAASWVQVFDPMHEDIVLSKLLVTGDKYWVPNMPGLYLMTGNSGGLEIKVDGEIVPSIGELGEIRRKVLLNPIQLQKQQTIKHN